MLVTARFSRAGLAVLLATALTLVAGLPAVAARPASASVRLMPVSPDPSGPAGVTNRSDRIARVVSGMTLRDKIGQLLVVDFGGTSAPAGMLRRLQPGGVIYFSDNLTTPSQLHRLSRRVHAVSNQAGIPALIGTDQEGGIVTRLPGPVSQLPGGSEFRGNATWAGDVAHHTGTAMRRMGLDVDFAPVADVNTAGPTGAIGVRSFGSKPWLVSRLVEAQICDYHSVGIATTIKHFPGLGATTVDSHQSLPHLHLSMSTWRHVHLPPFVHGIAAGTDLLMVGHVAFDRLDPTGTPASLSRPMVTHWLRHRLDYSGVVITDSLTMRALSAYGTSGQLAVRAVQAGVDLLLMPAKPAGAVVGLLKAVHKHRISVHRIDQSVTRILRLKDRLGLVKGPANIHPCR
jgi:beta-N-acetylhexosaminidase